MFISLIDIYAAFFTDSFICCLELYIYTVIPEKEFPHSFHYYILTQESRF